MPIARLFLLITLVVVGVIFGVLWLRRLRTLHAEGQVRVRPTAIETGIGFVTDFLDTLGISSFATTAALFRITSVVPDRFLPGTLNVGHALPTVLQALIYIVIVEVDLTTLIAMIGASVIGAHFGADLVSRLSERSIRIGMGIALASAALLMAARMAELLPSGHERLALTGGWLLLAVCGNMLLGALMTLGIGLYAPCMILVSLLDMNPKAAFPIMMGSCAFLMPAASRSFVRNASYTPSAALGLTLGGMPAVLIAAYIVKELDLSTMRWLVLAVVTYTAASLLRAAMLSRDAAPASAATGPAAPT